MARQYKFVVYFFQMRLFHYRAAMFEEMRNIARDQGIELRLIYGQASRNATARNDEAVLPWADRVKNWYLPISELKDLCWQPTPAGLPRPDLVVLMQENRLLANYWWLVRRYFGGPKVAYWGHGRDLQAVSLNSARNRFKATLARVVDWYFAYTKLTEGILRQDEFPEDRITVVNNAIDTASMRQDMASVSNEDLAQVKATLNFHENSVLGLYCGSLYPDKMLPLLIEACELIHASFPEFRLAIIGNGPSEQALRELISGMDWIAYLGAKKGKEKALYFRLASFLLNPGAVGLHVLDAFTAKIPLITTKDARHGPEIAYLRNGVNGVVTATCATAYAQAVLALINSPSQFEVLRENSRKDGLEYSIQKMAENFVNGMAKCLLAPRR